MKIKAAQTEYSLTNDYLAKMAIFPSNWLFIAEIGYLTTKSAIFLPKLAI